MRAIKEKRILRREPITQRPIKSIKTRKRKNIRTKETNTKNATTFKPFNVSLLKVKPFYKYERELFADTRCDYQDDYLFLHTRDVLDCIEDIYPFIEDDLTVFVTGLKITKDTPPLEVLKQMLELYSNICQYDFDIIKENGRYYIITNKEYDIQERGYSIPAEPFFKNRLKYRNLFQCFIIMCAHLWRKTDLWDAQSHEMALEYLESDDEYRNEVEDYTSILKDYKKAVKTLQVARKSNKLLTEKMINKIEVEEFKEWFKMGLHLINQKETAFQFINREFSDEDQGSPATFIDLCSIIWSDDDSNPIFRQVEYDFSDRCNNFGITPFSVVDYNNKDKTDQTIKSDFPYLLVEFLQEGQKLINTYLSNE